LTTDKPAKAVRDVNIESSKVLGTSRIKTGKLISSAVPQISNDSISTDRTTLGRVSEDKSLKKRKKTNAINNFVVLFRNAQEGIWYCVNTIVCDVYLKYNISYNEKTDYISFNRKFKITMN